MAIITPGLFGWQEIKAKNKVVGFVKALVFGSIFGLINAYLRISDLEADL